MPDIKIVAKIVSRNMFIMALALLACGMLSFYFGDNGKSFFVSSAIALSAGVIFNYTTRKKIKDATIQRKDAYLIVTFSWLFITIIGSLPFYLSGAVPDFVDALFESVSGFTTTGASILTDIESLPKTLLFWRSLTHWIGGIGIIVLVIIVLPTLQIGGYQLFTMESSLQEKIQPKIKSVGVRLLLIYLFLTLAEIVLLRLGNMSWFESVCNSFGTVATGGFSPRNSSIADYSPYIQYVIMIFMFLAGTNFVIHYYIVKGQFAKVKSNEEFGFYLFMVLVIGVVVSAILYFKMGKLPEEAFREGFFQVISIITCTGFATADYLQWPQVAWILILFIMFLGGCTGSTAGGIKMVRHLILFKNLKRTVINSVSKNAVVPIRLNNKVLSSETNHSILTFIAIYMMVFAAGSMVLIGLGTDAETSVSSVATCMAGIGPGIGSVGPVSNFAHLSDSVKLILSFLMITGRLEIYTILILFSDSFRRY